MQDLFHHRIHHIKTWIPKWLQFLSSHSAISHCKEGYVHIGLVGFFPIFMCTVLAKGLWGFYSVYNKKAAELHGEGVAGVL